MPHFVTRQVTPLSCRASEPVPPESFIDAGEKSTPGSAKPASHTTMIAELAQPAPRASTPSAMMRTLTPMSYRTRDLVLQEAECECRAQDVSLMAQPVLRKVSPPAVRRAIVATPRVVSRIVCPLRCWTNDSIQSETYSETMPERVVRKAPPSVPQGPAQGTPHVVTRQFTPLSYRVKDHLPSEGDSDGGERDTPPVARHNPQRAPSVGLSRNLDREHRGGVESVRAVPARELASTPKVATQDDSRVRVGTAAPRLHSRSPTPQSTPRPIARSWSFDREVPGVVEVAGGVLPQDGRASSPDSPVGRRRRSRAGAKHHSRSPTPQGTPITLSRDADRERHGGAPVTIWRGLDQERQPSPTVMRDSEVTGGASSRVSPQSYARLAAAAVAGCPEFPATSVHPPRAAGPGSVRLPEQQDLAVPLAATPSSFKAGQQPGLSETPAAATSRCCTTPREASHMAEPPATFRALYISPERRQPSSGGLRASMTPRRHKRAELAAAPFSSRSTLPANFRPASVLAGSASAASVVQPLSSFCAPPPNASSARVLSPGVSPRTGTGPSSVPSPGPYTAGSPCYPAGPMPAARPLVAASGAPPPPVVVALSGKPRRGPGPATPSRPASPSPL